MRVTALLGAGSPTPSIAPRPVIPAKAGIQKAVALPLFARLCQNQDFQDYRICGISLPQPAISQ